MYKTVKSPQKKSTCENMSPVELSVGRGGRYRHWLSFFAWAYELNWGNYRSLLFLSISVCQVEWKLYNSMLIQLKQYEGAITANQPAPTNTSIDLNPIINALSPGSELLAEVKSLTPLLDALLEYPSHIMRKAVSLPSTKRQTLVDLVSESNVVIQWYHKVLPCLFCILNRAVARGWAHGAQAPSFYLRSCQIVHEVYLTI